MRIAHFLSAGEGMSARLMQTRGLGAKDISCIATDSKQKTYDSELEGGDDVETHKSDAAANMTVCSYLYT